MLLLSPCVQRATAGCLVLSSGWCRCHDRTAAAGAIFCLLRRLLFVVLALTVFSCFGSFSLGCFGMVEA